MAKRVEGISGKVLVCARSEFLEKGFTNASLRNIAKLSETSTGAIYVRYPDKESLFDALVSSTSEDFFTKFKEAQSFYFGLIPENKTSSSPDITEKYLYFFINYIYEHLDDFKLILCCSEGTKHQNFIDNLVDLEVSVSLQYYEKLHELGKLQSAIHSDVYHMLVSAYYTTIFEVVKRDMKRSEALTHIKDIATFFNAGWESLLKIL